MKKIPIILILLISLASRATTYQIANEAALAAFNQGSLVPGDILQLQKGQIFTTPLIINNSGTAENRITITSYGTGANPIINGFTDVTAWTNLGSNIWESTNAVSTLSTLNMVSIGGVNTPMGRYPNKGGTNDGYLTFQSHNLKASITSNSLTGTPDWTGADLVVKLARWKINHSTITSQSGGTLNYSPEMEYTPQDGYGFFIQNDIRTLDTQNEWYYNPTTKKISIYSTSQPTNVKVASVDDLVTVHGSYITLDNITISGANMDGISNDSSDNTDSNFIIQNCSILFSGINGIHTWGTYRTVDNCTISDSNGNAILWSSSVNNATISDCTITNTGIYEGMASNGSFKALDLATPTNLLIEYNKVINTGSGGINWYAGTGITVRYNFVDNFCLLVDDAAGIYAYISMLNSTISNNIVVNGIGNAYGTNAPTSLQAMGIYLDDQSAHFTVTDNTVANCNGYGIYSKGGSYTTISGNTTFNCNTGLLMYLTGDNQTVTNSTINNIFVAKTSTQRAVEFDYPVNSIANIGAPNNNYYARPILDTDPIRQWTIGVSAANYTLAQWQAYSGLDANSHASPYAVTSEAELAIVYNADSIAQSVAVPWQGKNKVGTLYSTTITLQPYASEVLWRDYSVFPFRPILINGMYKKTSGGQMIMTR